MHHHTQLCAIILNFFISYVFFLREEGFILAHGFREFSPWLLGLRRLGRTSWWREYVTEQSCSPHDRQEIERDKKGPGLTRYLQGLPHHALFSPL
jgi:hypothetical protein